jgi:hypothetical protein
MRRKMRGGLLSLDRRRPQMATPADGSGMVL